MRCRKTATDIVGQVNIICWTALVPDRQDYVDAADIRNVCRRAGVQIGERHRRSGKFCHLAAIRDTRYTEVIRKGNNMDSVSTEQKIAAGRRVPFMLAASALMSSCIANGPRDSDASFVKKVEARGTVRLTGWAKLSGELEIYRDRESLQGALRFPNCISGIFSDQYVRKLSVYDGKQITVTGELFSYLDLPDEDRPMIPRKILGDSVIVNMCFGRNVLLIKSIKIAT